MLLLNMFNDNNKNKIVYCCCCCNTVADYGTGHKSLPGGTYVDHTGVSHNLFTIL